TKVQPTYEKQYAPVQPAGPHWGRTSALTAQARHETALTRLRLHRVSLTSQTSAQRVSVSVRQSQRHVNATLSDVVNLNGEVSVGFHGPGVADPGYPLSVLDGHEPSPWSCGTTDGTTASGAQASHLRKLVGDLSHIRRDDPDDAHSANQSGARWARSAGHVQRRARQILRAGPLDGVALCVRRWAVGVVDIRRCRLRARPDPAAGTAVHVLSVVLVILAVVPDVSTDQASEVAPARAIPSGSTARNASK